MSTKNEKMTTLISKRQSTLIRNKDYSKIGDIDHMTYSNILDVILIQKKYHKYLFINS